MRRYRGFLLHARFPLLAALLAFLLGLPFLSLGFQVDDYLQRAVFLQPAALGSLFHDPINNLFNFADGDPARTGVFIDRGMYPWITLETLKVRYGRPLAAPTHALDYALWPDSPALMHLHSLIWFAAAVFLVALLYRRLMGPTLAASLAALLFAIDDAHALPAGWIANRNSPVALVLGVAALLLHDRWRRDGRSGFAPPALILFAASLAAKEGAIAVTAYLFSYALFIDTAPLPRRLITLAPYAVIVVLWRTVYTAAGFGASGSAALLDPLGMPLEFLRAAAWRAPLFLNAALAFPPSDFHTFSPAAVQPMLVGIALVGLLLTLPLLASLFWTDRLSRFFALGALLAVIPICSTSPMDRLLDFTSIGAMGVLGRFFAVAWSSPRPASRVADLYLRLGRSALMFIHFILAPLLFVGMMVLFAFGSRLVVDAVDIALGDDPALAGKTVILASTGNYPVGLYVHLFRSFGGRPAPRAVRSLAPMTMAPVPLAVTRLDEFTLRVDAGDAYGPSPFRSDPDFAPGDRVELNGLAVDIVALAPDGWPATIDFNFTVPLEDPSLVWLQLQGTNVLPWTPPAVGETARLNESLLQARSPRLD